jgi:hypothetical protein
MTARERSDWFWNSVSHFGVYSLQYDSLAEITADSHLIVVGRVVDLQSGSLEAFEEPPEGGPPRTRYTTFGVVAVDDVLKGKAEMQIPGQILVARLAHSGMSPVDLPDGRVILFLKNYASMRAEGGHAVSPDAADKFYYARPNGYQGALRDLNGIVQIVDAPRGWEYAIRPFPLHQDGRPFAEVVDRIRELSAGA